MNYEQTETIGSKAMYTYDITVSYKGHTKTFRNCECEMHAEFYVKAIDMFELWLKRKGVVVSLCADYDTSYVRREKSFLGAGMMLQDY